MKDQEHYLIHSGHLYLLFTCLQHISDAASVHGILLYPTNGTAVDETYMLSLPQGIRAVLLLSGYTLDLNQPWSNIYQQLLALVGA